MLASIIIVNWNGLEVLRPCTAAIAENTHGTQVSGRRPSAGMIQKREI